MVSFRELTRPVKPSASSLNALHTMQANQRVSALELTFRRAIWALGGRGYRVQSPLPGRPDIVFGKARLAVFVHGCFWHRCPVCRPHLPLRNREFWRSKFKATRLRDARAVRKLNATGWSVIAVWECEIRADASAVALRIVRRATRPDNRSGRASSHGGGK
jgi:DNA mismatch endonuclease (patch repair protein)